MVNKFTPIVNQPYLINKYTMLHILQGKGGIQVDFQNYHDWTDKIIFLDKGQYIKFLSDGFLVRRIEFEDEIQFRDKEVRVLFKHLVSLGYINFQECIDCQKYLSDTVLAPNSIDIIDVSSQQWHWQNPFKANKEEYHVIFDIKELIDQQHKQHLSNTDISQLISQYDLNAHALYSNKIGMTIKSMLGNKRLLETKKEIAFSEKSIKEIAYEFGYKDPAYFNRVFKSNTGKTPTEFRKTLDFEKIDLFVQDLYELLHEFHSEQRKIDFYADKMHMSVKTLSKKVKDKLQISLGQLIRQQLIQTAKQYLEQGLAIKEVAYKLGFEEANHFTTFFKHYTHISPSEYHHKKYQE